ncbi:MAG: M1 family metallopeptidase [bacterium]|nr:M1 family metallopeptidase [bacterium]
MRDGPAMRHVVIALFLLSGSAVAAQEWTPETIRSDYQRLLEWRFASQPIAVPAGGLTWTRDTATWTLESGQIRLQEPTSTGAITGLVFEGRGRFRMSVPDPVERRHLARITERPEMETVDEAFTQMVLRCSDELIPELVESPAGGSYQPHEIARKRHTLWLEKWMTDVDARVVTALLTPGDRYLRAEMKTDSFNWLTYDYDDLRREEIQLSKFQLNRFTEIWVSLDRPQDRDADGRPSGERRNIIDVEHVDLRVDVTGSRRPITVGLSSTSLLDAHCKAAVKFTPLVGGARALPLYLTPWATVHSVTTESGEELVFLRDHLGGRTANLRKEFYDPSLVLLLDRPLSEGETRTLTVEYDHLMANFAMGRGWYPNLPDNFNDLHTAKLWIDLREKQEVRAIGTFQEETVADGIRTSVWTVDRPTKMVSFSFGTNFREKRLEFEGIPTVISFGPQVSKGFGGDMIGNVGADVVNSLKFFYWLFESELPVEQIQLTGIASGHGQAFEGFLHLSEYTYAGEHPGASEGFRAHETAHQWWGHEIGWDSYRDQWLSESFAEYSAMMFVQTTMKNGQKLFEEMLQMYTNLINGSLKGAFSKFGRPWLAGVDLSNIERMGPVALGYRASTAEIPYGYNIQAYHKGPLVLHMLRRALSLFGQGDDLFLAILRDFVKNYQGKNATTEDFIATVNKIAPGDWTWFFDQWIYGTDIPAYTWSYEMPRTANAQGQWVVTLHVKQKNVSPGFMMPVPVEIDLGEGQIGTFVAQVDQPEKTFTIPLPVKPRSLKFNPDFAVLATVKKR